MPVVSANGETIHYVKEGDGPAVVLVHGLGASVAVWRDLTASLKDRFTVIACDLRGHGGSSAHGEVSIDTGAQDLKAVLDQLGVNACRVVGMAAGAAVALTLAAQAPALVRALVLAGAVVRPVAGSKERVEATAEAVAYVSMEEFGTQYAAESLLPTTAFDIQDQLAALVSKVHPKVYMQLMRSASLGDRSGVLASIKAPTLVLSGDGDSLRAEADVVAAGIAGATLEVVPAAGPLAALDNPAAFNAAVAGFLDRHRRD